VQGLAESYARTVVEEGWPMMERGRVSGRTVLIVGGMITVCFTYLFGMRTPRLHVLMVVAFTLILALVLYTIRALEYPFDGIVQVTPQAFELVLDKIEAGGR
jgi:uncharacterized membrane protein YccC